MALGRECIEQLAQPQACVDDRHVRRISQPCEASQGPRWHVTAVRCRVRKQTPCGGIQLPELDWGQEEHGATRVDNDSKYLQLALP
jgi:hypothetical protein